MKVLIISQNHISSYTGGNEIYTHTLATALAGRGNQVTYLTNVGKPTKETYRLQIRPGNKLGKFIMPPLKWLRAIDEIDPDIVHATGSGIGITLTGLYCRAKGIKCVLTFQAPLSAGILGKVDEWIQAHSFNRIIVTSETNQKYLHRITKTPVEVVWLCLKPGFSQNRSSRKQKYILMVAKLDEHHYYKGVAVALQALAKLPKSYSLWLAGSGPRLPEYQQLANKFGVGDQIKFLGQVSDSQLRSLYQSAGVFILPSTNRSEGFGLVLLEAMVCGTPTITTNCVGIAPLLKKQGLAKVIQPNSAAALAQAIQHPLVSHNQIAEAKKFALSRTPALMAKETERVYEQLYSVSE